MAHCEHRDGLPHAKPCKGSKVIGCGEFDSGLRRHHWSAWPQWRRVMSSNMAFPSLDYRDADDPDRKRKICLAVGGFCRWLPAVRVSDRSCIEGMRVARPFTPYAGVALQ